MSQLIFVEEDELKDRERLIEELEWYKNACGRLIKSIDQLCEAFLEENWYIADPVNNVQASEIIVDEVIHRYGRKKKKRIKKNLFGFLGLGGK